jgi:PTH1 family peptidyl-tRNA hydrolase
LWIVVGLGNPGRRYSKTRHNAGFMFIKKLAKEWRIRLKKRNALVRSGEVMRSNEKVLLVLPQTYMNQSGQAVTRIMDESRISPERLIVVYDDLDMPLGEIRIKKEGGAGTHKGMISIIEEIETTKFPRIRLGIGSQPSREDFTHYVLSSFDEREKVLLDQSLEKAQEALEIILAGEIEKAMNIYNTRKTAHLN